MRNKPCPCGKTPVKLILYPSHTTKYATAAGNCCSEWFIEFNTGYNDLDTDECMELAIEAWNNSTRKEMGE